MVRSDIRENVRFHDPRIKVGAQNGKLVTRTYHRTTLWMMLYDDGDIVELHNGDLEKITLMA